MINGTGYAEFNNVLIRGNLSTAAAIFNPGAPNNLFPTTSYQYFSNTLALTNLTTPVIVQMLTYNGWATGSAGLTNNRYGQSAVAFLIIVSGGYNDCRGRIRDRYRVLDGCGRDLVQRQHRLLSGNRR